MADMTLEQVRDSLWSMAQRLPENSDLIMAECQDLADAIAAHLAQQAQAVDGWKLVPAMPTPSMLSAAAFATSGVTSGKWNDMAATAYVAMLSAFPTPDKEG